MELCRRECWGTPDTGGEVWGADTGASAAVKGWILAFIPAKLATVENTVFHNRPLRHAVPFGLEDAIAPFLRKRLVY